MKPERGTKMNKVLGIGILACGGLLACTAALAEKSAADTTIEVNPTTYNYGSVAVDGASDPVVYTVRNRGSSPITLGAVTLSGAHGDQYALSDNQCDYAVLNAGDGCTVNVTYKPTARGHKQALLNIPSNTPNTPVLQAFLASREDLYTETSRRLPPVLASLNIPETMQAGQTYHLEWSLLGYHDGYKSNIVLFDCSTDADNCGANYYDETRFDASGNIDPVRSNQGVWSHKGVYSTEYHYSYDFTPSTSRFNKATDIVVRIYRKNTEDEAAGRGALSLIIPGNLSEHYYDTDGRRLKKVVVP